MTAISTFLDTQTALERHFHKISRHGRFDALLPKPGVGIVFVGGPRNRAGILPAETRNSLNARFRSLVRQQDAAQKEYMNG